MWGRDQTSLLRYRSGDKLSDQNSACVSAVFSIELDPFDLVKSFGCEVSLATVATSDQRDIFDQEEISALPESFRNSADTSTGLATVVADYLPL